MNKANKNPFSSSIVMIDAHCHLSDMKITSIQPYDKLEKIVGCGYDLRSSNLELELKKKFSEKIECVIGISPQKCMQESTLKEIEELKKIIETNHGLISGIGEIGLDYHWAETQEKRKWQGQCFRAQIELANEFNLPIVVHSRDATELCIKNLERAQNRIMFHFFTGTQEEAKKIEDLGWVISIPPLKGKNRREAISAVDIGTLVAETDAPYVGKTPLDVEESIKIIANEKQIEFDQAEKITSSNCKKIFGK